MDAEALHHHLAGLSFRPGFLCLIFAASLALLFEINSSSLGSRAAVLVDLVCRSCGVDKMIGGSGGFLKEETKSSVVMGRGVATSPRVAASTRNQWCSTAGSGSLERVTLGPAVSSWDSNGVGDVAGP